MQKNNLKILMVAAEMAPFVKVGGLADVVGSLPAALEKLGCEVRLVIPLYGLIDKKKYKIKKKFSDILISSANKSVKINLWQVNYKGVRVYFVDYKKYFSKKAVYYGNNSERFLFFSLACLKILPLIKFKPDIIHCHDFHTALTSNLIKKADINIKTLYTIHNLNHQGKSEIEVLSIGNLAKDSLKSLSRDAQDGDINFMAQGIINADLVNTVSPTYAREIITSVYGAGLERIIKENKHKFFGILNGLDIDFFNPASDRNIKYKYSVKYLTDKVKNKLALQKQLGLPEDRKIALVGFISRLAWQKGIELITEDLVKDLNCQFVFLGTGQKKYADQLKKLASKYSNKVSAQIMFNLQLAQQIYAAADIFLMPSRFEPCGLGQIIAMRYGAVPLVRATGGLADTVDKKVGFSFDNFSEKALDKILKEALDIYYRKPRSWKKLQKNGMKRDFSWDKSAQEYLKLYQKLSKAE